MQHAALIPLDRIDDSHHYQIQGMSELPHKDSHTQSHPGN